MAFHQLSNKLNLGSRKFPQMRVNKLLNLKQKQIVCSNQKNMSQLLDDLPSRYPSTKCFLEVAFL